MNQYQYKLGPITIHLPDEGESSFSIIEDLAEVFGKEYQSEAVKLLRAKLKEVKPKPSIDYESDNAFISTSNIDTLLTIINTIIELSDDKNKKSFPSINQDELKQVFVNAKKNRPKPKKWDIGDVFAIPLSDHTFSIGQVIDKRYGCTCALFDIHIKEALLDQSDFRKLSPVSILHLGTDLLNNGTWQILFNEEVTLDPAGGRGGKFGEVGSTSYGGGGTMTDLADVYFGLQPWNVMYDEDCYDKMLLKGLSRPNTAIVLSEAERQKYRQEKLGTV